MSNSLIVVDQNYAFNSATTTTSSTADSNFPITNLAKYSRAYSWRSNQYGNFVIDSTNNKINFKESGGGSELTATLSSATYSALTLATEIASRMTAATVNARTYTCSYSLSTGKWTITGATYLSILWNTGSNHSATTATTIGFSAAADSTGATTYTGANIALHTEEWILFDLGSAQNIDSFIMLFDPQVAPKFSNSATLKIQGNASNAWTSPSVNVTVAVDSTYNVITKYWSSSQNYRYWRVSIVDPTNSYLYVEVPKIVFGLNKNLTRSISKGFQSVIQDLSVVQSTEYGHRFIDQFPIQRSFKFKLANMPYTDAKILDAMYKRSGSSIPVFAHLSSGSLYDTNHLLVYGWLSNGNQTLEHVAQNFFTSELALTETY